jgi:hypothetical protein
MSGAEYDHNTRLDTVGMQKIANAEPKLNPNSDGQEVSDTVRHQVEPALIEIPMIAFTRVEATHHDLLRTSSQRLDADSIFLHHKCLNRMTCIFCLWKNDVANLIQEPKPSSRTIAMHDNVMQDDQ